MVIVDQVLVFGQVDCGGYGKGICPWLRQLLPDSGLDLLQILSEELDVILRPRGQHVIIGGVGEHDPFHVQGVVEMWLSELVDFLRTTLRLHLEDSVGQASVWDVEKSREDCLLSFPVQIGVLTLYIVWT